MLIVQHFMSPPGASQLQVGGVLQTINIASYCEHLPAYLPLFEQSEEMMNKNTMYVWLWGNLHNCL